MLRFITATNLQLYDALQEISNKYNALNTLRKIIQIETVVCDKLFKVTLWYEETTLQNYTYFSRYNADFKEPPLDQTWDIKIS